MILSNLAIRRPVTTTMVFAGLCLLGAISLNRLPIQLIPEVVYPEVMVMLTLPGASPEQIERDLLIPTEGEIDKLPGVAGVESYAMPNAGGIRVSYMPHTDMKFALVQLQTRVARLQPDFPERTRARVQRFDLGNLSADIMQLYVLGEGDLNDLRDFAEEEIRPELEAIDGVVNAAPVGGRRSSVDIVIDQQIAQAFRLSLDQIRNRINAANRRREYVGPVSDGDRRYPVSVQGQFTDLRQVQDVVIDPRIPLRLGDVASVHAGLQEETDRHRINGKASVGIRIQKDDEANLLDVSREVEREIERLNREFAAQGVEIGVTASQAELIEEALATLQQAAVAGALLGLTVLFFFLRNLRFVGVLLLAIPVSLLVTFNLMYAWDLSLNVLSLCGLALAVGMLTDNGIVVMESIFKQFERGKSPVRAAQDGTAEVGRAVVASTATTVMVFLPVVFVESDFQDMLRDLSLSITFPLLVSLLVALTLVPALAVRTLGADARPTLGSGRMLEVYTLLLKACLRHRAWVAAVLGVLLAGTLIASFYFLLQQQVREEETRFTVYVDLPEGSTLDATDAVVREVEAVVGEIEGLDQYTSNVQEAQASVTVQLHPRSERPGGVPVEEIKQRLEEKTQAIQGGVIGYEPRPRAGGGGGGMRRLGGARRQGGLSMVGTLPSEQIVIRGYDFAILEMIAEDLNLRLQELESIDANTVQADVDRGASEVQVLPDDMAMFDYGLDPSTVLNSVGNVRPDGVQTSVPFLNPDATEIPILVRAFPDGQEFRVSDFRETPVLTPDGLFVSLDQAARVRTDEGRRSILRTDQSRRATVSYRFVRDVLDSQPLLDDARRQVHVVLQEMSLPEGYTATVEIAETDTVYYWMMGIAALLIYMILASLFESFSSPIIILCTVPPAVIGSCWALIFSGTGLTQQEGPMALLGVIVLLGIAVNNGIILIDSVRTLQSRRGFRRERAVLTAGRSRVRPILMTSATTLLGVLPLALEFGGSFEIWPPFAITVLGGLSFSMAATLFLIPVATMGLDQVKAWLADLGWPALILATLLAGAAVYGVHTRYESLFWTVLSALPAWGGFLALFRTLQQALRIRAASRIQVAPVSTIRLRNLTKVYGAPGRFAREWKRDERRAERLLAEGQEPVDRKAVREGLGWKVPLLGLAGYLHVYFEDAVWVFLVAAVSWAFVFHLIRCVEHLRPRLARPGSWLRKHALPVLFVGYVHVRLDLLSVTLACTIALLLYYVVRCLADRVRSGRVDPERFEGRLARPRQWVYRAAAATPLVGVRAPEVQALWGVDLEIGRGMFGLLGPNGAGKTTLMRIVCQVLEPSYGSVTIDGHNIIREGRSQGLIGYLPQHFGLYDHLSACEYLEYRALLEGFKDGDRRRRRVMECLEQVNLLDRKDDSIGSFSGGMRQRVGIAQTLLHMPWIIVVDEPTAGLDPLERIRFRNLLAQVSRERIVIFSTHIVEDISGSCNRLAVLKRGRVLYTGSPQDMRRLAEGRVWEAVVSDADFARVEADTRVITHIRAPEGIRARFLSGGAPSGVRAQQAAPTLEDAYLYLLERTPA